MPIYGTMFKRWKVLRILFQSFLLVVNVFLETACKLFIQYFVYNFFMYKSSVNINIYIIHRCWVISESQTRKEGRPKSHEKHKATTKNTSYWHLKRNDIYFNESSIRNNNKKRQINRWIKHTNAYTLYRYYSLHNNRSNSHICLNNSTSTSFNRQMTID